MNKVFEHAGDLVNVRVAHNLMRLIAEGFGEDDEGADSQLRFSAVSLWMLDFSLIRVDLNAYTFVIWNLMSHFVEYVVLESQYYFDTST